MAGDHVQRCMMCGMMAQGKRSQPVRLADDGHLEIDRRIAWLSRRMAAAKVIDPAAQPDKDRIFFGAKILFIPADDDCDDAWQRITLVGEDEADASAGNISWNAPMARAFRGAAVDDVRRVRLPSGERSYIILEIEYPEPDGPQ